MLVPALIVLAVLAAAVCGYLIGSLRQPTPPRPVPAGTIRISRASHELDAQGNCPECTVAAGSIALQPHVSRHFHDAQPVPRESDKLAHVRRDDEIYGRNG